MTTGNDSATQEEGPILGPLTIVTLFGFFICLVIQSVAMFLQAQ